MIEWASPSSHCPGVWPRRDCTLTAPGHGDEFSQRGREAPRLPGGPRPHPPSGPWGPISSLLQTASFSSTLQRAAGRGPMVPRQGRTHSIIQQTPPPLPPPPPPSPRSGRAVRPTTAATAILPAHPSRSASSEIDSPALLIRAAAGPLEPTSPYMGTSALSSPASLQNSAAVWTAGQPMKPVF
ncbi:hypothetical protein AAFF_G00395870 [Aldrovandia affinis]|uniref:Uncharacterized protein n=1 Tax=Aldrovandia affinis TaxID=143900 RepID=A0AAD7SDH1_9TELE|nr:hypothetical protein AAFF_G00395870 [Aldrovandia affinis]